MKPIAFLDVDGVLNGNPQHGGVLHPPKADRMSLAIGKVPGVPSFMRFLLDHFDVYWLTAWCMGNKVRPMRTESLPALSWLTDVSEEELAELPCAPWHLEKMDGVKAILERHPDREWVWIEDELSGWDLRYLIDTDNLDRFYLSDNFESPDQIVQTHDDLMTLFRK